MGIKGIYGEIGHGQRIALSKLAVEKFEQTGRPLRIAIDTSIWLFQIQASKGGTNPALRTFYYRLLRLIALSIHPVFVFDGPNKPPFKRGKRTGANVASIPEFLAKQLLKQFGFPIHLAPGEAEAECALLQREGIVDAVLSEDVDTLMFGSGVTIRNWSPEQKTGKTPTHVNVYDAVKTKNGPSGLDREGMILVAMMSGGDYVPEGIPKIGIKTACEAARAGFGHDLCKIARNDKTGLREWKERLKHEIMTNESKFFSRKKPSLIMPDDFPRMDILGYYTHPVLSSQAGLDKLKRSIRWDQDLDFSGLRDFAHDAFDWVKLEGAKHFIRSLAPSLLVRQLRMRGEQNDRLPLDDPQAIEEDEALLVKGLHGMRQHAITDSTTELRVSYIPIDLVKIDLSKEEPDEELEAGPPGTQAGDDEDDELLLDDDEEGPKKRGPTKFDPSKPARAWVLETYVKVGAPLKVQDWEAARAKPSRAKRTASADATKPVAKPRVTRRAKTTTAASSQVTIDQFAKVTKPGARGSRAVAKLQSLPPPPAPAPQPLRTFVDITSSPAHQESTTPPLEKSEYSLSSTQELLDLPSSITKRRKRAPIQRSRTLPLASRQGTPSLEVDAIECLDLSNPTIPPSPSQFAAKKPRTQSTTRVSARGKSVSASPTKSIQSTLDTWASPSKCRNTAPIATSPIPAQPEFRNPPNDQAIETLDLTLSSPVKPAPPPQRTKPKATTTASKSTSSTARRTHTITDVFKATKSSRPALVTISSNPSPTSSFTKDMCTSSYMDPPSKPPRTNTTRSSSRRTSPHPPAKHSQIEHSTSPKPYHPEIDTIDLTSLSPLQPNSTFSKHTFSAPSPPPPAPAPAPAWKLHTQTKKICKREVVLRNSLDGGAWTFIDVDVESPGPGNVGKDKDKEKDRNGNREKEKARRKWRESEIEVLDLS